MRGKAISIAKETGVTNEDAVMAQGNGVIAVSDGAGGGGVYAECWSAYLLEHLPTDVPLATYAALDGWIDGIWETFYNRCEEKAKAVGGLLLDKFYDEGSFATLVAVWRVSDTMCQWMSYGDSVAFCYNRRTDELKHSFTRLADFNKAPYLINCKDPLKENGFRCGQFLADEDSIVFAASDTLAHYVLMMYEVAHRELFTAELEEAVEARTKDSNFVKTALGLKNIHFQDVLYKLLGCMKNKANFRKHIEKLKKQGLLGYDDYSLTMM